MWNLIPSPRVAFRNRSFPDANAAIPYPARKLCPASPKLPFQIIMPESHWRSWFLTQILPLLANRPCPTG